MQSGTVTHLCIAPDYGMPTQAVESVVAVAGKGLEGDRYFGTTRQVTIVCEGELAEASTDLGMETIPAGATRRNITVTLPSLPRSHGTAITIGAVELQVWRDCAPCEVMETAVGPGAREALRSRAGVAATVSRGGIIKLGDPVSIAE
jgi:MOSC domain-containing protein YiiM